MLNIFVLLLGFDPLRVCKKFFSRVKVNKKQWNEPRYSSPKSLDRALLEIFFKVLKSTVVKVVVQMMENM